MCKKSTTITMSSSLADDEITTLGIIKEGSSSSSGRLKQYMRTSSSLSTASSDFEFDSWSFSELNNEPPISPKLNYSPNWEIPVLASANHNFADRERAMNSSNVVHQDHGAGLSNEITVNYERFNGDFEGHYSQTTAEYGSLSRGKSDYVGGDDQISRDIEGDKQEFSSLKAELSDAISVNDGINGDKDGGEQRSRRVNLRSLLERRDVEQLPPLASNKYSHQMKKDQKLQISSSSSASSSSPSPLHQCSDQYCSSSSPCRNEDDHPSTPKSSRRCEKKWAFKLDFLRRTVPSSRADNNHQRCSSDQASNSGLNQRCSFGHASTYGLNQRCSSDLQSSNYGLNESHGRIAAAAELVDDQLNYSVAAAITKFDSPRKSTGSSSISSSPKQAGRNASRSAPISPAASPPRSSTSAGGGAGGAFTPRGPGTPPTSPHIRRAASPRRVPMSPHALHYQQQKARGEELRRKTFLPYRQSLLAGACFFPGNLHSTPPPAHHPHSPAPVYC